MSTVRAEEPLHHERCIPTSPPTPTSWLLQSGDDAPTSWLLQSGDDAVTHVLAHLDVADLAAAAAACRHLHALSSNDSLWRTLAMARWPLLPARSGANAEAGSPWRELHRKRAELPRWRELCGLMDELEHTLAAGGAPSASASWGERLAALVLAVFGLAPEVARHDSPPTSPHSPRRRAIFHDRIAAQPASLPRPSPGSAAEARAWVRRVTALLRAPAVLRALRAWGAGLGTELEAYYEYPSVSELELKRGLVRALRGASALSLLREEFVLREHKDDGQCPACPALELWVAHGLDSAVDEIASGMRSLEMEGFHVAIPPSHRPHVPASHVWWRARPPIHSSGRIHYC